MKLASGAYISEVARGGVSKPVRTCFDRGLLEQVACSSCIAGWPHSCHFVDVPCWTQPRGRECWPQLFGPGSSFKTDFVWADQQRVWLATWWNTILRRWMLRFKVVASNLQNSVTSDTAVLQTLFVLCYYQKPTQKVRAACGCLTAPALCRIHMSLSPTEKKPL